MDSPNVYSGSEAISFLVNIFESLEPDRILVVRLSVRDGKEKDLFADAKVSIAGFCEEHRKEAGCLEELKNRKGSVFLYGDEQPDHCLVIKHGRKPMVLPLEDILVQPLGMNGSTVRITSETWKMVSEVIVFHSDVISGDDAIKFFKADLLKKINKGTYSARLGKWISRKGFDRNRDKSEEESKVIGQAIEATEVEIIKTMSIGTDIERISLQYDQISVESPYTLTSRQQHNATKVQFRDMIIEHNTSGKEIGAKHSASTYAYLIGATFNAPSNLVIIRHRERPIVQDER